RPPSDAKLRRRGLGRRRPPHNPTKEEDAGRSPWKNRQLRVGSVSTGTRSAFGNGEARRAWPALSSDRNPGASSRCAQSLRPCAQSRPGKSAAHSLTRGAGTERPNRGTVMTRRSVAAKPARPSARLRLSPGDPPKGPSDFDQRPPRIARLQSINQSDQVGTDCRVRQEVSVPPGAGIFVDFDQVDEMAGVCAQRSRFRAAQIQLAEPQSASKDTARKAQSLVARRRIDRQMKRSLPDRCLRVLLGAVGRVRIRKHVKYFRRGDVDVDIRRKQNNVPYL